MQLYEGDQTRRRCRWEQTCDGRQKGEVATSVQWHVWRPKKGLICRRKLAQGSASVYTHSRECIPASPPAKKENTKGKTKKGSWLYANRTKEAQVRRKLLRHARPVADILSRQTGRAQNVQASTWLAKRWHAKRQPDDGNKSMRRKANDGKEETGGHQVADGQKTTQFTTIM